MPASVDAPDLDIELPRSRAAAGIARERVRETFEGALAPERFGDVQLAVSELVANAVMHGRGEIRLRLRLEGARLYGEVTDDGGGFEHEIRARSPEDVTGRGLAIVSALADEWGVHEGSTHVWFGIDVDSPSPPAGDPKLGDERRPRQLD